MLGKKLFLTTGGNINWGRASPHSLTAGKTALFRKVSSSPVSCKICQECYANLYVRITKHKSVGFARGQWQLKANAT